jgi:DNA polymerase III subunit epsilon
MLDWIKNIGQTYPEFWKNYLVENNKKSKRFVAIAVETTGLNPKEDVIIAISAFAIKDDALVLQDCFDASIFNASLQKEISESQIIEKKLQNLTPEKVVESFINYIGNAVLIGENINFTIEIIETLLEKTNCGKLKNQALDIAVIHHKSNHELEKSIGLDGLCQIYKIDTNGNKSALFRAYQTALLFLKLKNKVELVFFEN